MTAFLALLDYDTDILAIWISQDSMHERNDVLVHIGMVMRMRCQHSLSFRLPQVCYRVQKHNKGVSQVCFRLFDHDLVFQ